MFATFYPSDKDSFRSDQFVQVPLDMGTNNFSQYMELVNKLPDDDKPSMFGLPENIMQSYQRTQSTLTINQLRTLMRSL